MGAVSTTRASWGKLGNGWARKWARRVRPRRLALLGALAIAGLALTVVLLYPSGSGDQEATASPPSQATVRQMVLDLTRSGVG
ncbi:MAG: hypothetical protein V3V35_05185, partial [Dehalococcoidia bacterium]